KGGSGGSTWFRWQIGASTSNTMDQTNAHLLVAVNVTFDDGTNPSLDASADVLFTQYNCHQGAEGDHPNPHATAVDGASTDVCNQCHIGYDHLYNYMDFPEFPSDFGDVAHANKLNPPAALATITSAGSTPDIHYNTTYGGDNANDITTWSVFLDEGDTSDYCYSCHFNPGSGILDYGSGAERSDVTDRPSCGVASKNLLGGGGATVTCHATTNITGSNIPLWDPPGATSADQMILGNAVAAVSHNRSGNSPALPCASCHLSIHSLTLPDPTSDSDLSAQCKLCHTSDGPSVPPHTASTTNCGQCHKDGSSVFNVHEPTPSSGGRECGTCHDVSGSAGYDVDVTQMGDSASVHRALNAGANGTAEYLECYACHGTLAGGDGTADWEDQPEGHPPTYKTPRGCPDCHNNADA
ncbi:MAG: hypothetical protein KAH86_09010, partial [Methanosarcinales archaeon]|nr:hypothetical protein [Methanosarcinales archaeon]